MVLYFTQEKRAVKPNNKIVFYDKKEPFLGEGFYQVEKFIEKDRVSIALSPQKIELEEIEPQADRDWQILANMLAGKSKEGRRQFPVYRNTKGKVVAFAASFSGGWNSSTGIAIKVNGKKEIFLLHQIAASTKAVPYFKVPVSIHGCPGKEEF